MLGNEDEEEDVEGEFEFDVEGDFFMGDVIDLDDEDFVV